LWVHAAIFPETLRLLEQAVLHSDETISFKPFLGHFSRFCVRGSKTIELLQKVFRPVYLVNSESSLTAEEMAMVASNGKLFLDLLDCEGIHKIWPPQGILPFETLDCRELLFSKDGQASLRLSHNPPSCLIEKEVCEPGRKKKRLLWPEVGGTDRFRSFTDRPSPNEKLNQWRHQERLAEWTIDDTFAEKGWMAPTAVTQADAADPLQHRHKYFSFPILLVRTQGQGTQETCLSPNPTSQNTSLGVMGWDLIIPSSCAMIVWLALVYGGAHAAGIQEMDFVNHCTKIPVFPCDYPDTSAGRRYWSDVRTEICNEINKRPLRKKKTRTSLSFPHWDHFDSSIDSEEMSTVPHEDPIDLVVVRRMEYLSPFVPVQLFDQKEQFLHHKRSAYSPIVSEKRIALTPLTLPFRTVLRVILTSTGRGVPQRGAQIFAPCEVDYQLWIEHRSKRNKKTTSRGRKVADWWGGPNQQPAASDRRLIGYVTSSVKTQLPNNPRIGTGFCEALSLRETLHIATHLCQDGEGEALMLILYKNPQSKWFRPALIELQAH
jgi:hypothetical protein